MHFRAVLQRISAANISLLRRPEAGELILNACQFTFGATYSRATLRSLWKTGDPSDGNSFEMDASLYWGGYESHPALKP
ncbi:hypothetical protein [Streptomyces erythrochromogenes]|uniref:hypothetical protein n=1 Tax=Streptomyces erythrochromogenes TaxID=285574 RepID=UPI00340ACB37